MSSGASYKAIYRILSWSSLAGLILALVLVLKKSPAPDIPYDPDAAKRVEQKFAAADKAKSAGQAPQVQMDRTELNSYMTQNLELKGSAPAVSHPGLSGGPAMPASSALPSDPAAAPAGSDQEATLEQVQSSVKDVKIDMEGDLVKAYVVFDFHGKDLSLELDGHLSAEDGYVKFDPVAGKLGSLPLPQSTLDSAVEKMMSSPENREKLKLPEDISNVHIVDGQAVVSYK